MLFLFECWPMLGLGGTGGAEVVPLVFRVGKLVLDEPVGWLEGGVELAYAEFNVEEDFCEGTLLLESLEESEV